MEKENNIFMNIGKILLFVINVAFIKYFGISFFIPAIIIFFSWLWLNKKIKNSKLTSIIPALAIQSGQVLCISITLILSVAMHEYFAIAVLFDILILIIGLMWLIMRPGIKPIILLSIYQILSSLVSITNLIYQEINSPSFKASIIQLIIKIAAVFFMVIGYKKLSQKENVEKTQINN
jgi:hypothetical protein